MHCFTECGYTLVTDELQIVHKMKHDIMHCFECYLTPRKLSIVLTTSSFYLAGGINGSTLFSCMFKQDRQCTHKCNIEARSRNHCRCWKAMRIYISRICDCGLSQNAKRMSHYHPWPVWLYHIFFHDLINGTIFGNTLLNITFCLQTSKYFSF